MTVQTTRENTTVVLAFLGAMIIVLISIMQQEERPFAPKTPSGVTLSKEWHTSIVSKAYYTWDDIDIFFEDGTRVVLSSDIFTKSNDAYSKLKIKSGMSLHFINRSDQEKTKNTKLKTYICASKTDPKECTSVSLVIKSSFHAYTWNQGFVAKSL